MLDAVIISDIHLGSDNCQAKPLVEFLDRVHHGLIATKRLILNGDVFDSIDFRRLKKHHWKILSEIRKLSDHIQVTWINGNHDGPADVVSHLLGVECADEIVLTSGDKLVLILHGHRFDSFISKRPRLTKLADIAYNYLQRLDKSHTLARLIKRRSKTFLRATEKVRDGAVTYAATLGCNVVCCGHTHLTVADTSGPVQYYNSGCWTEKPGHYLTLASGEIHVHPFTEADYEKPELSPRDATPKTPENVGQRH